jgi:hypothetical protein
MSILGWQDVPPGVDRAPIGQAMRIPDAIRSIILLKNRDHPSLARRRRSGPGKRNSLGRLSGGRAGDRIRRLRNSLLDGCAGSGDGDDPMRRSVEGDDWQGDSEHDVARMRGGP